MHLWSELCECSAGNVEGIVIGGTVEASMSVNLDPNGDGFGGKDHAVLLAGGSQFKIEFADQVKFNIPGESKAVLNWHHDGKGGFKGYLGQSTSVTLSQFLADLAEASKAGELLHNVLGKIDLKLDVGVEVQVRHYFFALDHPTAVASPTFAKGRTSLVRTLQGQNGVSVLSFFNLNYASPIVLRSTQRASFYSGTLPVIGRMYLSSRYRGI